jgi:hypothetical protein
MCKEVEKEQAIAADGRPHLFARQSLPVAGKIAFWAAVVGGILSLGGNIALVFLVGSPNISSIIILLCWLASIVLLVSRWCWAPLMSTLPGAALLYQLLATPYVIANLTHPNRSVGGFGTFVGDMLAIVCALLVLVGSLVATIQNYRGRREH